MGTQADSESTEIGCGERSSSAVNDKDNRIMRSQEMTEKLETVSFLCTDFSGGSISTAPNILAARSVEQCRHVHLTQCSSAWWCVRKILSPGWGAGCSQHINRCQWLFFSSGYDSGPTAAFEASKILIGMMPSHPNEMVRPSADNMLEFKLIELIETTTTSREAGLGLLGPETQKKI